VCQNAPIGPSSPAAGPAASTSILPNWSGSVPGSLNVLAAGVCRYSSVGLRTRTTAQPGLGLGPVTGSAANARHSSAGTTAGGRHTDGVLTVVSGVAPGCRSGYLRLRLRTRAPGFLFSCSRSIRATNGRAGAPLSIPEMIAAGLDDCRCGVGDPEVIGASFRGISTYESARGEYSLKEPVHEGASGYRPM
jgi:hypothetical protein